MDNGGTICGLIVIIIISVGITILIYSIKHVIDKGVDSVVDNIHNEKVRKQEAANPPQQQSLAEKYGIQNTSTQTTSTQTTSTVMNETSPTIIKKQVASNEWQCPKCGTVNLRYVSTCGCGCSISEAQDIELEEKAAQRKKIEQEIRQKEEKKTRILSQYENYNLSSEQDFIIRMLVKESAISLSDMCRKLPRSADLNQFKENVNNLVDMGIITKNEEGKYFLTNTTEESQSGNQDDTITCPHCGKTQKKNQFGCIYCHKQF